MTTKMAAVYKYSVTRFLLNFSILQCKNHVRVVKIARTFISNSAKWKSDSLCYCNLANNKKIIIESSARYCSQPPEKPVVESEPTTPVEEIKQKPKKEKKPKPPAIEREKDVSRLDLRVGKIVNIKKHPDADSLYVAEVSIGDGVKSRTVVTGLVKHVPIEELENRMVVLLCNMRPATLRGVPSEAMILCANTPDKVEVLSPPDGSVPGDVIKVEGYQGVPDLILKKKTFDIVAPDLQTNESKVATYKGAAFSVPGKGVVTVSSLVGVNIK